MDCVFKCSLLKLYVVLQLLKLAWPLAGGAYWCPGTGWLSCFSQALGTDRAAPYTLESFAEEFSFVATTCKSLSLNHIPCVSSGFESQINSQVPLTLIQTCLLGALGNVWVLFLASLLEYEHICKGVTCKASGICM